jgi:hypothetical protein
MADGRGAVSGAEVIGERCGALMKRRIFALLSSAVFLTAMNPAPPPDQSKCVYDKDAMLALEQKEFDQDPNNGWRKVAVPGCKDVAADLIRVWRTHHNRQDTILFWHEGQLRAEAGQYQSAIKLFEQSTKTEAEDGGWGWNIYVHGSIAFLQGDKRGLKKATKELANLPKPANLGRSVDIHGNTVEVEWPLNLHILKGFIRCWGQSYGQAYACPAAVK